MSDTLSVIYPTASLDTQLRQWSLDRVIDVMKDNSIDFGVPSVLEASEMVYDYITSGKIAVLNG